MNKRVKKPLVVKTIAVSEMILMISMSFAIAVILQSGLVTSKSTLNTANEAVGDSWKNTKGEAFDKSLGLGGSSADATAAHKFEPLGMKTGISGGWGYLAEGVYWAAIAYGAGKMLGSLFGMNSKNSNALGISLAAGAFTYNAIQSLGPGQFEWITNTNSAWLSYSPAIAIAVAIIVFIVLYKEQKTQIIKLECLPWEPPLGGSKCEECNKDLMRPCSEYRCKSLGQACELLNPGTNEEKCTWVSRGDVKSATITPWKDVLYPTALNYNPDNAIRPPNRGVKIVSQDKNGCLQAFTPLRFGITTDEPTQCKIDYNRNNTFDTMQYYFGETNYYSYNHTQKMLLPSAVDNNGTLSPLFQNDGTFSLYIKCRDANGNVNEDAFVMNYCVDKSPDTTAPSVEGTSISNNGAVQFNIDKVPIQIYTNEPSDCKWSRISKAYSEMENAMTCSSNAAEINANMLYTCSGELNGIKNREDNLFYFRCKDKNGNTMAESYALTLKGSQPLNILETSPKDKIIGATEIVAVSLGVKTDDGADEGKAACYFSTTTNIKDFVLMAQTSSYQHNQSLNLPNGNYTYYFRCIDAGGNTAESNTTFGIFVDKTAPKVTRAYQDGGALKIITDEDSECTYSLKDCNYVFAEGQHLDYSNADIKNLHFTGWRVNVDYYIKCKDIQGNEPDPNQCSIIARGIELGKGAVVSS